MDINDIIGYNKCDCGAVTLYFAQGNNFTCSIKQKNLKYYGIDLRKKLFSEFGGSYESYVATSGKIVPTIVVAINLYEAFDETYFSRMDVRSYICPDRLPQNNGGSNQSHIIRTKIFSDKFCLLLR